MDHEICWTLTETAMHLRIGQQKVRELIEEEGLPILPVLGEREHHIFVPALMQWLWKRTISGGAPWQSDDTATAPGAFPGAKMGAGRPVFPIPQAQTNANRSTERRGGRQNRR